MMKKTVLIYMLFLWVTLFSCKEDDNELNIPLVATVEVTEIKALSAIVEGLIVSDSGLPITSSGICWSTNKTPDISDSHIEIDVFSGNFVKKLTGLLPGKTYYVRAYAKNSDGVGYGMQLSFTTLDGEAEIIVEEANDVTAESATFRANILNDGGSEIALAGFCLNNAGSPTIDDSVYFTSQMPDDSIVFSATELIPGNTYFLRAFSSNETGVYYSSEKTFTTMNGVITISTYKPSEIKSNSAVSGGDITDNGGSNIRQYGLCWSRKMNPTTADSVLIENGDTINFQLKINTLNASTLYYIRSFAVNAAGTFYGEEFSFLTVNKDGPGEAVSDDEGNSYKTVWINNMLWMAENLKTTKYSNGDDLNLVEDIDQWTNLKSGAYCEYNNNNTFVNKFGRLYNHYAVTDNRNICPDGWHVSTLDEWNETINYLIDEGYNYDYSKSDNKIGIAMTSDAYWKITTGAGTVGNQFYPNKRNKSGFSGLPGGGRVYSNGKYFYLNVNSSANWWTTHKSTTVVGTYFRTHAGMVDILQTTAPLEAGYSVRCVKNKD